VRLRQLHALTTDDVHFVDPFHDVRGRAAMRTILERMFDAMT
jgi:ketosteroid isomerase-like protein